MIQGLFNVVNRLYGIQVIERQAPLWHTDAHYYELEESRYCDWWLLL